MKKNKAKNEQIKRKYFEWLKGAKGYSIKTIEVIERAIWIWEEFSKEDDYATFNQKSAQKFKKWLSQRKQKRGGISVSLTTQYNYFRYLSGFFLWLSGQSGYKSRVSVYDIQFLKLDKAQTRLAIAVKEQKYPSLDYVKRLCDSIEIKTEVDQRDRALIAFHFLSAMRVSAIFTLPLGCFDIEKLQVTQDPMAGVKTKFSKRIFTTLIKVDDELLKYILEWVAYLKKIKCFSDADPMFPKTKLEQKSKEDACFQGIEVEPEFWKTEGPILSMFRARMSTAKLPYFSPHKFRHASIAEARKYCRTEEQRKALSQNVGHDNISTTFTYGNMSPSQANQVISKMRFSQLDSRAEDLKSYSDDELFEELKSRRS